MKKYIVFLLCLLLPVLLKAQSYADIVTYHTTKYAAYGAKIKTNLNFANGTHLPTIIIEGYNLGTGEPIGIVMTFYINQDTLVLSNASSFGSFTPPIYIAEENGKVVIMLEGKDYYQRFAVRAFAKGMLDYAANYQGWTVVDEPISPASAKKFRLYYQNRFTDKVLLPGGSVWDSAGLGIGTAAKGSSRLAVDGTIAARRVKVTQAASWPDYVFQDNYPLMSLEQTAEFIRQNKHLPEIPTTDEVAREGVDLGEMNRKLLQKLEEMTLHMIEMKKKITALEQRR
ncbi:hypothetical protein [Chitinophaga solisilvae]|uniref:hypothetical protein n=1 Tax=Chitinophaga solisilvae TaxID=1233460 RepID=UPI00136C83BC|nr:hypothetical protein [Chitinophaga solisilvae]